MTRKQHVKWSFSNLLLYSMNVCMNISEYIPYIYVWYAWIYITNVLLKTILLLTIVIVCYYCIKHPSKQKDLLPN